METVTFNSYEVCDSHFYNIIPTRKLRLKNTVNLQHFSLKKHIIINYSEF